MTNRLFFPLVLISIILTSSLPAFAAPAIGDGMKVTMNYTMKVEGTVVDSTNDREPLQFVFGENSVMPGFEKNLEGLEKGATKTFTVPSAEAFGDVDARAVVEIPKAKLPAQEYQEGMVVTMPIASGEQLPAIVTAVNDQTITLDFNHPLAGKDIDFDVEIIEVSENSAGA